MRTYSVLLLCLALLCGAAFSAAVSADDSTVLRVGLYDNPPKIFVDDQGNPSGFWPDIVAYIASEEGWEIEYVHGTWAECLHRLETNEIDVLPDTSFTEARSKRFAFSNETVLVSWTRVYGRKGADIQSVLDLEGTTVAGLKGSANFDGSDGMKALVRRFDIDCTFVDLNSYVEVFEALERGEVDAGVTNKDFGNVHEGQFDIERTPIIFRPSSVMFAFTIDSSSTPYLVERIDYHIKEMKADWDSVYYRSMEKHLAVQAAEETVVPGWVKWLLAGTVGLALLLLGGTLVLRAQVRSKTKELREELDERARVQQHLSESEEKFRSLFEQSMDAIHISAADGSSIEANRVWLDLFGYSRSELQDLSPVDFYANPEDREGFVRRMAEAGFVEDEVRLKKKDGTVLDCQRTTVARTDVDGNVVSYQGIVRDITEQKRAQQVLKDSEEKFRELFEQSREAITLVAPDGRILDVNQAGLDLFGYSRDDLPGLHVVDLYADPEDREDALRRLAETGYVEDEVHYKKKDGTVFDCHRTIVARKDEHGNTVVYQSVHRDITEQKRAQQALKDSEERYRELFEQSREAISLAEPTGRMVDVNQAWLDLYGYSRDELPGLNVVEIYANPEDRGDVLRRIEDAGFFDGEARFKKKDGTVLDCRLSMVARKDEHGNAVAYQALVLDITARKKADEELRSSEERYRRLFEQSTDAIYMGAVDGTILEVNQVWLDMLGYSREDLPRINSIDLYANPGDREHFVRRVAESGFTEDEVLYKRKDGSVFLCQRSVMALKDESGAVVAYQGVNRDITEQKRAQEQLEEGRAQLQRMLQGTLDVVERMSEARDPYTAGHQRRVAELSTAIARQLGLPEETCVSLVDMMARVHDIGKTGVPVEILAKPGKLNDAEFTLIKIHPQVGYDILKSAGLPYPVAEAVLQHHERLDGSGYPQGLSGDDILPEAQILAVADVVEAMSSHRPYRAALGIEAALEEVSNGSGTRYYPDVVEACLAVFRQEGFAFSP